MILFNRNKKKQGFYNLLFSSEKNDKKQKNH